ncbi:MAG: hypothetical protein ACE5F3_03225 [Mariprofundaceae bacterium]
MPKYKRFYDTSVSERILNSMFLLAIGLGYLFAMVHLYFSHQGRDGQPGLSVEDVRIAYYGEHQRTRLGAALNGSMAGNLEFPDQKQIIFDWIANGTNVDEFNDKIAPIFNNNCVMCHSQASGMGLPPLTNYEEALEMTKADTGASVQSLVRVSHIHLFGIAFILFFVGRIFILCEMPVMVKRITVGIPFFAMLLDIMSWYITKAFPGFAIVVVIAGGLMGISFAAQVLVSLYQMWFYKPKQVPIEM